MRFTSFLMIPLTTLYDEYIIGQKLTEEQSWVEHIVPLPLKWVGTIIFICIRTNTLSWTSWDFSCLNFCQVSIYFTIFYEDFSKKAQAISLFFVHFFYNNCPKNWMLNFIQLQRRLFGMPPSSNMICNYTSIWFLLIYFKKCLNCQNVCTLQTTFQFLTGFSFCNLSHWFR